MTRSAFGRRLLCLLGPLVVVVFVLAAGSTQGLAAPGQSPDLPPGLSAADWVEVQSQIEAQQPLDVSAVYAPPTPPPQPYLKASNTDAGDYFGWSVAISGDTVVVGAYTEASGATGVNGDQSDNKAPGSGAAYVFVRSGGAWKQQAYLKASNTEAADLFGYSVAIFGETLVVGAMHEDSSATGVNGKQSDNSATNSGAAYVFTRNEGIWTQEAYLKASNTGASDRFGASVAIDGDTVVVGAYTEASSAIGVDGDQSDSGALNSGAAYVFARSEGVWRQEAYLKASNTGAEDRFGTCVAISGDTVVVGAYGEDSSATGVNGNQSDNSASSSGAAYVFARIGGAWTQEAYLKASNTGIYDYFGGSVAISEDTVVVGGDGEASSATGVNGNQSDNSASSSGAAYVFARIGGAWTQKAYLKASNTEAQDWFGFSVAISGDTLVVGALGESSSATGVNGNQSDNGASRSAAAYLFTRSGGAWKQGAYLKASNTEAGDRFGHSVAISRDTVLVGAREEDSSATGVNGNQGDNSAPDSGAAYVLVLPSPPTITNINPASGPAAGGTSVIITGTGFIGLGGPTFDPDAVTFGGVNATSYTVNSPTQITATAPAHAGGTVDVQVTALGGSSANTTADDFAYPQIYTLTYTAGANGIITGTTPQTVAHGASGTAVTAVPNADYHFVKWSDEVATATRMDTNVTGNITVSATFAADTYALTYASYRGTDRYDTALKLSKAQFAGALPADSGLVLAPGETFPQALCGAPLAAAYGGPVLLTGTTALYGAVRTEMQRLAPKYVICIGLSSVAVDAVKAALPTATVTAINGAGTTANIVYDMSRKVANALAAKVGTAGKMTAATAIITCGDKFPDAIGVSPLACAKKWPIILTPAAGALHVSAAGALSDLGITQTIKVGTYVTMPAGVTALANLSGADRYQTNANVATWAKNNAGLAFTHIGIATGDKFPDALASGPFLAKDSGLLLLSPLNGPLQPVTSALITANRADVQKCTFIAMIEPVIGQVKALLP